MQVLGNPAQAGLRRTTNGSASDDQRALDLVLEFGPHGILPDINGPDTSRKKVGGGVVGSGSEIPFWENIE